MPALLFEYMNTCPECVTITIVIDMLNPFVILYAITLCHNDGGLTQNRCKIGFSLSMGKGRCSKGIVCNCAKKM